MTTLADVNATLGVTNIALAGVSKNTEKTNEGITGFLDYLKGKDATDRRREIETSRETKPILKSITGGAATIGGGLVSAGKSTFGFGKDVLGKLALPAGFLGGFLTSLLSSKLLKGGILGLAFMFGDEIAEMLTGPDAKKEVKDQVAGALKGGAVGFLFGPRFGLIGTILGGLLANEEIDQQAGNLIKTLEDMKITLPSLSGIFKSINEGVADGLKGINAILKGNFSVDSTVDALKLLGGAAFLISPAGSLFLLKGMARTRIGRVLMALAGIGYATGLLGGSDKKVDTSNPNEMKSIEAKPSNPNEMKNIEAKPIGEDVGGFTSIFKGLDTIDTALLVSSFAYLSKQVWDLGKGMFSMFTGSFSKTIVSNVASSIGNLIKSTASLGAGFLKGLLNAGKFGMSMVGNLPVLLPLAAMGGLISVLNNKESSQKLAMDTRANTVKGKMTQEGINAGINITGGGGPEMMDGILGLGKIYSDSPTMAKVGGGSGPTLAEYFQRNSTPSGRMDPTGNAGDVNMLNSNNRIVTTNNNAGVVLDNSGAIDRKDNLSNQIRNPSNLF